MQYVRWILRQVIATFKLEAMTTEGRINFGSLLVTFFLVVSAGRFDVVQVVVRTWNADYETGLPSTLEFLKYWLGAMLLCVVVVGVLRRD